MWIGDVCRGPDGARSQELLVRIRYVCMQHVEERAHARGKWFAGLTHSDCDSGGKACGQASVMLHWDDDSPIRRAFSGYVQGRRAALPIPADAPTPCPQKCIHGICEQGSCKCWKGVMGSVGGHCCFACGACSAHCKPESGSVSETQASGADCSRLAPLACHRGRKLGLSLSGVSYWTRLAKHLNNMPL